MANKCWLASRRKTICKRRARELGWSGADYKEADEAPDIMDAVGRKLRRADYTYTQARNPQQNATSTITFLPPKAPISRC